jgi:Protein of unknown function (DUF3644)
MPPRPRWWHQLQASKQEVTLAVDLYNRSGQERLLEAFIVHMAIGWTKLIQGHYEHTGLDVFIRQNGRRQRSRDREWLTKPLHTLMEEQFQENDPIRVNLDFMIGLRNRIEHRHDHDTAILIAGRTQALILNYERTLTTWFGVKEGLAETLRFPLFLSAITEDAVESLKRVRARLPKAVLDYIQDFDAALDPDLARDQAYDFRITLIPQTGPKTEADVAMTFVRLDDLTDEQRLQIEQSLTIVREKQVAVADLDSFLPRQVCEQVEPATGFRFSPSFHHNKAALHYGVHPPSNSEHPERTKGEFCLWSSAFSQYVYTQAWVNFLSRHLKDPAEFETAVGVKPTLLQG